MRDAPASFGPWKMLRVIGRGAVGTVYEAEGEGVRVALKILHRDLAREDELRARFMREAEAVQRLDHPNIVRVLATGEVDDQPFIALELVEGTDMERVIASRQPLSVEWKLDLIRQTCEGLAHAHACGIVHRDVKPANVRISAAGEVKVMDFGMARLGASDLTRRGRLLGAIHYSAPEQLEGGTVDQRSDVFSVGAVAFELLSYRRPFEAESLAAVMMKILGEPPDSTALPRTDYSPGLERVVLKALEREPQRRQQSLNEMRSELREVVRETARRLGVT